jgi:hypothetical protein
MFAKVFSQIFDSSIAEDASVRHVFMDLLILADSDGVVDMTAAAIARRTNVALDVVEAALARLSEPDHASRSKEDEGRRIVLIDSHREWGWQIVNYAHYRALTDNESRRSYFRDRKRAQREKAKCPQTVLDKNRKSKKSTPVTHGEGEGEVKAEEGREGDEENPPKRKGTLEEIRGFCKELGLPESDGDASFHKWQGNGWRNGTVAIKCWRSTIRAWKANGYMPSQKANGKNGHAPPVDPMAGYKIKA